MARWGAVFSVVFLAVPLLLLIPMSAPPAPSPLALTSADIPTWLVGDAWTFATHAVTRDGPNSTDAWNNLTFTVIARIEAMQDGAYRYLYNSTTLGNLSATGTAVMAGIGTVRYTIASNNVRGYAWTERGDLAVVKTNESFSGSGTAAVPVFGNRPLTASGNVTTINRPPQEDFDFPIELGDAWRVRSTLNTTGRVRIVINLAPFPDAVIDQPLGGDTPLDANYTGAASENVIVPAGAFDTLRVHSVTAGGALSDRWYAPNASNYVRLETHSASGPTTYTHTWTNLTAYALAARMLPVTVTLSPAKVGPGGPFTVFANTTEPNAPVTVVLPAINFTATGSTDGTGAFRMPVNAPADNDDTPANTDVGSHGVLVVVTGGNASGYGAATVSLLRPDLAIVGLSASPVPVGDGVPTNLTTTVLVTTDVPVYSPVLVTFVAEDVDVNRDGRLDNPMSVYCARTPCANATVAPLLPGNSKVVSVIWTPSPPNLPADLRVSAVVDPNDRYEEVSEVNNLVVTTVRVEGPNLTPSNVTVVAGGTAYVFDRPASLGFVSPLIVAPTGSTVNLTAIVKNDGVMNVTRSTVVAFYNTTGLNGTGDPPFAQFSLGPVDAGAEAGLATVPWRAPIATGTYYVNITADHDRSVRETSETDNTFVVRLRVYDPASAPDLVPVSVSIPAKASVNRTVTITTRILNRGVGNASGFQVAFFNASQSASPFAIVNVGPLGAGATSSVISATWSSGVLGPHDLGVEVDYGNAVPEADETNNLHSGTTTVYDVPATSLRIGTPRVVTTATYITSSTPLSFISPDRTGQGPPAIWYRVDSGPWTSISEGTAFMLPGGPHTITFNATDALGGVEPSHLEDVIVDDLPPETRAAVANATGGKAVTFTASDLGVGVSWTEYRVDGGAWTRDNGTGVRITAAGNHTVEFRSADLLGNLEPTRTVQVPVAGASPNPSAGFNVKPALAVVFGAMLLLAGWFAAPSPDPPRRRRWFLTVVLPPAALELATGAVSLVVPAMAVPGGSLGVPVDAALLAIGLLVIVFSRRRALRAP